MVMRTCPHCGAQPGNYFDDVESDDFRHVDTWHGSKAYEGRFMFDCEQCGGTVAVRCVVARQPGQNEVVLEMEWSKIAPDTGA